VTEAALFEAVARDRAAGRTIAFANGCFDLLHVGHVRYLQAASREADVLVVAVNGDASAKRLGKGADRPVNRLADRAALVAALESVGLVTWFDEDTPLELIRACRPDVLVKGGDWKPEAIVGAAEVKARGGSVHSIPFRHQVSTTALLEKIRSA